MAPPNARPDAGPPDDAHEPGEPGDASRPDRDGPDDAPRPDGDGPGGAPAGSPPPESSPPGLTPPGPTPPGSTPPASTPPGSTPPASTPAGGTPPEDTELDVDARWQGIVAELSDLSALGPRRGGAPADDDRAAGGAGARGATGGPANPLGTFPAAPWVRGPGPRDWPATPEVEALEEAESHFVPPDPPPVLGRDPLLTMAWSLVVGVPVLLLVLFVLVRPFPVVVGQIGGSAFLVGLGVLLWRMPHRRDDDDAGPGAVV